MKSDKLKSFLLASRPKTLFAALTPVLVGSALAYSMGSFKPLAAFVALTCAVLIQVATNFVNDLYDFLSGADNEDRLGPTRALASGQITIKEMRLAIIILFCLTFLLGLYLVSLAGWPVLIIGVVSIMAGYAYTAGPFPLAYNGLGDLFVFVFFGLVATVGTYYVQVLDISSVSILVSIPCGALITNILIVNNYRDVETDRNSGKKTLAVILGRKLTRIEYILLLLISFFIPFHLYFEAAYSFWILIPFATLPLAINNVKMLFYLEGKQLNKALEMTARFSFLFGLLFSIGIIL